jgi:hypothetical protein
MLQNWRHQIQPLASGSISGTFSAVTPIVQRLLATDAASAKAELDRLSTADLLAPSPVASADDAALVKAALYLRQGYLDECHRLCQAVPSPNGSYWHGIMHRHERDLGNSRYWYRQVGAHPVLEAVGGYPRDKATEQREFDLLLAHTIATATGQ